MKSVQTRSKLFELDQIGSNRLKPDKNQFELDQTGPNRLKPDQTS